MAETFHNDINKVADMLLVGKDEVLKAYPYLSSEDYDKTMNDILKLLFPAEVRVAYKNFLVGEGLQEYSNKILGDV